MNANRAEYLFSVSTHTPPTMTVDSGGEFTVEVRGAFDDVEDISAVPTPFTPAYDGHRYDYTPRPPVSSRLVPAPWPSYAWVMCGRVRLSSDVSEIKLVFSIPLP
jgi:hypothetical protein